MRIGIVDYLLRTGDSMLQHLAREIGFDSIELSVDRLGDPDRLLFDPHRPDDFLNLARTTGVAVDSLAGSQFLTDNLLDPDPARRRSHSLIARGLAERASQVGVPIVLVPLLGASDIVGANEETAFEFLLPLLAQWGDTFGVTFALKTTLHGFVMRRLLDEVCSDRVGLSFDPGLMVALGRDPILEWVDVAPLVCHVHLTDRTLEGISRPLGDGDVPLEQFLQGVLTFGYAGPIILSTPTGANAQESAQRNRIYLERLLTRILASNQQAA